MNRSVALSIGVALLATAAGPASGQSPRPLLPIPFESSAEYRWLRKPVLESRVLDAMDEPARWSHEGTATVAFRPAEGPGGPRVLRVDMQMFTEAPAPTRNQLSTVYLRRTVAGEDWSGYNRLSVWIRPEVSGFPMLPLHVTLRNEGAEAVPDVYRREGIHYVTLRSGVWQQVLWEIEPLPRDRVTSLEIGYWVNRMLAEPSDRAAFEIGAIELQRVEPDHYEGWEVAPGRISFSHSGYSTEMPKSALASGLSAADFQLVRVDDSSLGDVVLSGPVETVRTPRGEFQRLDFSDVRAPGSYFLRAGDRSTQPFRIGSDVWEGSLWKALNFFYGERCGFPVPGIHGVDHLDWFATQGDRKIVMSGGWHDAGDLSQGLVNTGEAVYAMFATAERLRARGGDPALVDRLIEEARWGLEWVMRVRFDGGYRIGFASHHIWSNGIVGDADDRSREALNNPNVNYIAAAAGAIAHRVLRDRDPDLAARSLRIAADDWRHAIAGVEGPETWSTPAFQATPLELAGIGILASMELYEATGAEEYLEKALELAPVIVQSQQRSYLGSEFPLAGFFYAGPDRRALFHQFHRGNDQAPIVALARLLEALPDHPDWMRWYGVVARYSDYQRRSALATAPYEVLPAYLYRDTDHLAIEENDRYQSSREAYRLQVLEGLPIGDGLYLRAFPIWFARRGNYGVLLSQAKALSTAARVRGDAELGALAERQAQWVVGRNPFVQSTMYGEGHDWMQLYSVSSGDLVGALPVGMKTRGNGDLPYWPAQNVYTFKEVWVHSTSRWIWLMEELLSGSLRTQPGGGAGTGAGGAAPALSVRTETLPGGEVAIELAARGEGVHRLAVRAENLRVEGGARTVTLRPGETSTVRWRGRVAVPEEPWYAVIVPDGAMERRVEARGALPRYERPLPPR